MRYVVELRFKKDNHTEFDSAFLEVISKVNNEENVKFICDNKYWKLIEDRFKKSKVIHSHINIKHVGGNFINLLVKELFDIINIIKVIKNSYKDKVEEIYFTCLSPISTILLKKITHLINKKIFVVHHSELEGINEKNKIYQLKYWSKYAIKINTPQNFKHILLGESIYFNLKQKINVNRESFIVINHPYFFYEYENYKYKKNFDLIKMGGIGAAFISKNSHMIFLLADSLKKEIESNRIEFEHIGKIHDEIKEYTNAYVKYDQNQVTIERKKFEEKIEELDYTLYFYDKSMYKLTPSGALFDAINFEKPIIALKNDFFKYYFEKMGNIGYLCDDIEEMKTVVMSLIKKKNINEYELQVMNLKRAKKALSISTIKNELKNQLNFNK